MNFSIIEDSMLEEKKKIGRFLSRFLKNSRVLIILLTAAIITAISISMWIKSPEYKVLYRNLSHEDGITIIKELNQRKIPYQFSESSGELSVPIKHLEDARTTLSNQHLPKLREVGFELLDQSKFGISQFHEQINYQRALEGELSRTIQKINFIQNSRVHLAIPKSSLFLEQNKKKPSASIILELRPNTTLNNTQIDAILNLVSKSVSGLSTDNITIVDQLGNLLNRKNYGYNQINYEQVKYSQEIESLYSERIKKILEPIVGIGNINAEVTAQINFNTEDKTKEEYLPNTDMNNQSVRSRQDSIHNKIQKNRQANKEPIEIPNKSVFERQKNIDIYENKKITYPLKNLSRPLNSMINHDYTINYELNHTISHTKMRIGEIKRLSAAVVINVLTDQNGKLTPFTLDQIKNIKKLICESIGYSKKRGDSIHVFNAPFVRKNHIIHIQTSHIHQSPLLEICFILLSWFVPILLVFVLLKKYIIPFFRKNSQNIKNVNMKKDTDIEQAIAKLNMEKSFNTDNLIHKICNISNQNPRNIALIIRKWMSDKK